MTYKPKMRVRVRPIAQVEVQRNKIYSTLRCLSVPHMGEAIDAASGLRKLQEAEDENSRTHRVLHHLHLLGEECNTRCLYLDYVKAEQPKDEDELDVAGLVAKAK